MVMVATHLKDIVREFKEAVAENKSGISGRHRRKALKVRKFHLGQKIRCDRDEIYAERG